MNENNRRTATGESLELSAEGIRSKITPAPVSHLRKQSESASGIDEDLRQQIQRIESKLDAIFAFLKNTPK